MRKLYMLLLLLYVMLSPSVRAQDIHFSQFNASPLTLNPALTGVLLCDYRFVANYKSQWQSVTVPYRTIDASYDMRLQRKAVYDSYGSIGINLSSDKEGTSEFSTNKVDLYLSYNKALSHRGDQFVSVGIQGGYAYRSINEAALTFDNQWDGTGSGIVGPGENVPVDHYGFGDIGMGALWYYSPAKKLNSFYGGIALWHLNQPVQSFYNDPTDKLFTKMVVHAGGQIGFSRHFYMMPSAVFFKQGPHTEFNVGSYFKFKRSIKLSDPTAFYVGAWYRMGDAMIVATRFDIQRFNIGLSYDFNLSTLSNASHDLGGLEISLIYQGCFNNNKKLFKFCPVL